MICKQLLHCKGQNTVLGSLTHKIETTKSLGVYLKTEKIIFFLINKNRNTKVLIGRSYNVDMRS